MKERPILFSAPMVRAILAGTKTQTRRVIAMPRKRSSFVVVDYGNGWWPYQSDDGESELCGDGMEHPYTCPYGEPGDRLWVRETWRITGDSPEDTLDMFDRDDVQYRADDDQSYIDKYRPSIHMPRWASRILLEVIAVRVERLQDISEADAIAEGIERAGECNWRDYLDDGNDFAGARYSYRSLWEQINGPGSWDANPWVWVVEFRRVEA